MNSIYSDKYRDDVDRFLKSINPVLLDLQPTEVIKETYKKTVQSLFILCQTQILPLLQNENILFRYLDL